MDLKKPYVFAILIQCIYAGMILLSKAAFNEGMNSYIFIFYRQLVETIFIYPFAFIFERKATTSLTFVTFCKMFFLALLGITIALNMFSLAIVYTSASLAAATVNSLPVLTFFFAFLLRMEELNIRRIAGIAKVIGMIACVAGVGILAFYEGPQWRPSVFNHTHSRRSQQQGHVSSSKKWIIGCFLVFISIATWALWLVLQARVLKSNPLKLYFTSIQCLSSAIQSFFVAIVVERDISEWKLGWNLRLLAVLYCVKGIMVTGVSYYLQAWVITIKRPVFQATLTPLNLIITIVGSVLLLGDSISLSSIIGGILLVVSLYSVLWGKSHEQEEHPVQVMDEAVENNGEVYNLRLEPEIIMKRDEEANA